MYSRVNRICRSDMSVKYHQPTDNVVNVASPCVRNCCLDKADVCLGCFRHIDEIMAWSKLNTAAKQEVLSQCEQRRQQHKKIAF